MQRFEHGCIDDGDGNDSVIGFENQFEISDLSILMIICLVFDVDKHVEQ